MQRAGVVVWWIDDLCYHRSVTKTFIIKYCSVHFLQERGGFFSGILKKSNKTTDETPAQVSGFLLFNIQLYTALFFLCVCFSLLVLQENLRVNSELSASNDSLSGNNGTKVSGSLTLPAVIAKTKLHLFSLYGTHRLVNCSTKRPLTYFD